MHREGPLAPYRALDLTDAKGFLCGKMLADLGAEVIKVEPPGGDPSRMKGPFYRDDRHPERSLFWFAYNLGKKGITLNLEQGEGRELFLRLVERADWVIESFPPGHLEGLGLGYEVLSRRHRGLILTSISAFGQQGPYRDYQAPDIVGMAMGGMMFVTGEPDRPPVRVSFPQAWLHACGEAAVASMMALYYREQNGEGQWVDVSMQASVVPVTMNVPSWWEFHHKVIGRQGTFRAGLSSGAVQRQTWPCKNGYVTFVIVAGAAGVNTNRAMVDWMDSEGMADDFLKGIDWQQFDMATASQEFHQAVEERIGRFFLSHTPEELYEGAMQRRIMLYPVATIPDIAHNRQLADRGYWVEVEHPELGTSLTYPGAYIVGTLSPCRVGRRAPLIGEDNQEVYGQLLGLAADEIARLREKGVI